MRAFLASVLSLIAVGVLLIAYGLQPARSQAPAGMIQRRAGRCVSARPGRVSG
jgi:hypothetical protein